MQDRPSINELLMVVRHFLESEVVPALSGRRAFHARVAANVLAIVAREIDGEETALAREWARLAPLVGRSDAPAGLDAMRAAVREATAALAERIRQGDADGGAYADAVRAHVRATVREKLAVANPRYLGD
jgi:hypothetical protein